MRHGLTAGQEPVIHEELCVLTPAFSHLKRLIRNVLDGDVQSDAGFRSCWTKCKGTLPEASACCSACGRMSMVSNSLSANHRNSSGFEPSKPWCNLCLSASAEEAAIFAEK